MSVPFQFVKENISNNCNLVISRFLLVVGVLETLVSQVLSQEKKLLFHFVTLNPGINFLSLSLEDTILLRLSLFP